jgi:hypothetical protein
LTVSEHFRALAWGVNAPVNTMDDAGSVLWFTARINGRLQVRAELPFHQMTERMLAHEIRRIDATLHVPITMTVAAPAIFPRKLTESHIGIRGETISERLAAAGIDCVPGDDDTLNGWARVHALFEKGQDGPYLTIDSRCEHLIKSLESALSDDRHPDVLATDAPALTALRLGVMSRPSPDVTVDPLADPPVGSPAYYMRKLRQGSARSFGEAR